MKIKSKDKQLFELAIDCNQYVVGYDEPDIKVVNKFMEGFMKINHDKETQKRLILIIAGLDEEFIDLDTDIDGLDLDQQSRYLMAMDFVMNGLIDNYTLSIPDSINQKKRMTGLAEHFHKVIEDGASYDINDLREFIDKIDLIRGSTIENEVYAIFLAVDEKCLNFGNEEYMNTKEKLVSNISNLTNKLKEDLSRIYELMEFGDTNHVKTLNDGHKVYDYDHVSPLLNNTVH